jgi:GntR family transcriptional regulator
MSTRIQLDTLSHTPLYLQLEQALRVALATGTWKPGQALPPERELAEELQVSRITLRKALDLLEAEGLLLRRQGSGTFVNPRVEQPLTTLTGFSQEMELRGLEAHNRWLQKGVYPASPEEAAAFGLEVGTLISRLERVRLAGDEPLALELAVLQTCHLPRPQEVGSSLYAHLDQHQLRPVRASQRIRAIAASPRVAELLRLRPTDPVLYLERHTYLPDGSLLEFTRSHYRGDRYEFVAELKGSSMPGQGALAQ